MKLSCNNKMHRHQETCLTMNRAFKQVNKETKLNIIKKWRFPHFCTEVKLGLKRKENGGKIQVMERKLLRNFELETKIWWKKEIFLIKMEVF